MKHLTLKIAVLLSSSMAFAGTDIGGTVEKLKVNEQNAKDNAKQYQANIEIAAKNLKEADAAIAQLRDQKQKLLTNGGSLEKNRAGLDSVQKRLEGFRYSETDQLKREDAQVAKLKDLLQKLESNKQQREKNIADYDLKIADLDKDRKNWQTSQSESAALKREIEDKEARAVAEREKWAAKKKGYQAEATKWEKQARTATDTRAKVEKLAN